MISFPWQINCTFQSHELQSFLNTAHIGSFLGMFRCWDNNWDQFELAIKVETCNCCMD